MNAPVMRSHQRAAALAAALLLLLLATPGWTAPIVLHATLDGGQEVPPTPSAATAEAMMSYDPATDLFDLAIVGRGIDVAQITTAYIYDGAVGVNGPPLVDLDAEAFFGGGGLFGAAVRGISFGSGGTASEMLLAGGTYINLHTTTYPSGEIRGQLVPVVPEPTGLALVGAAAAWIGIRRRRS